MEAAEEDGSSRALVDGGVVGECWIDRASRYSSHPQAAGHAFVQWIGTEVDWRDRGVGRQLWAATCAWLYRDGVRRISLSTPCDNFGAQGFYFRVGLRVVDQGLAPRRRQAAGMRYRPWTNGDRRARTNGHNHGGAVGLGEWVRWANCISRWAAGF